MGVYLRYEDKWYCQGSINGERYNLPCQGAHNIKEAKAVEDGIRYQIRLKQQGLFKEPEKTYTLKFMMDLFLENYKNKNKSDRAAKIMSKYILEYFGSKKNIRAIKKGDIESFMKHIEDKGRTKATANRYLSAIKRAYNVMIENDYIEFNPAKKVKKYIENNNRYRFLSHEEWERLKEVMSPELKDIVVTALCTGFRLSNVLNLHWNSINLKLRFIELLPSENKSKKNVKLPINNILYDLLMNRECKKGYVFVNPRTGKPYTNVRKSFNTALENAGIKDFHFHDLRRTFGTWLLEQGIDIRTIQKLLAHSDISTTERYLVCTKENLKNAVDIIDTFMQ